MATSKGCWYYFRSAWRELSFAYFESKAVLTCVVLLCVASMINIIIWYDTSYSCPHRERYVVLNTVFYITFALEMLFSVLAVFDLFLALTFSPSLFGYFYSWMGICDVLSALPIFRCFALFDPQNPSLDLFQYVLSVLIFFRLAKVCRIGLFYKQLNLPTSAYYVLVLIVIIFIYILIVTSLLLGIDQFTTDAFNEQLCMWAKALYFTVTVISTVGFGDIVANSALTRALIIVIILGALVLIPTLIANVMSMTLAEHSSHSLSLSVVPYDRWICICGIAPSAELIQEMLVELSSTPEERAFMIILLSPELPGIELAAVLNDISYHARVRYYMGSAQNPTDLRRIKAEWANAIYIVSDLRTEVSLRNQEDSNYLTCIAVNAYLRKQYALRQVASVAPAPVSVAPMLLNHATSITSLSAFGGDKPVVIARLPYTAKTKRLLLSQRLVDIAVPIQELKYSLLSYGMIFPGFLSLFTQLSYDAGASSFALSSGGQYNTNGTFAKSRGFNGLAKAFGLGKKKRHMQQLKPVPVKGAGQARVPGGKRHCRVPRVLEVSLVSCEDNSTPASFMGLGAPCLSPEFLALTFEEVVCCLYAASKGRIIAIAVLDAKSQSSSYHSTHRQYQRPANVRGLGRVLINPVGSHDAGIRDTAAASASVSVGGSSSSSTKFSNTASRFPFSSCLSEFQTLLVMTSLSRGDVFDHLLNFDPGAAARAEGSWMDKGEHAVEATAATTSGGVSGSGNEDVRASPVVTADTDDSANMTTAISPSAAAHISQRAGSGSTAGNVNIGADLRRSSSATSGLRVSVPQQTVLNQRRSMRLRTNTITGGLETSRLRRSVCTPRREPASTLSTAGSASLGSMLAAPSPISPGCSIGAFASTRPTVLISPEDKYRSGSRKGHRYRADWSVDYGAAHDEMRHDSDAQSSSGSADSGPFPGSCLDTSLATTARGSIGMLSASGSFPQIAVLPPFPGGVPLNLPPSLIVDYEPDTADELAPSSRAVPAAGAGTCVDVDETGADEAWTLDSEGNPHIHQPRVGASPQHSKLHGRQNRSQSQSHQSRSRSRSRSRSYSQEQSHHQHESRHGQSVPRFRDHILLVMTTNGAAISARASLIPIVSVVRTLRREVDQQIVVLSDKIPDLEVHLKEIEHTSPRLLQNVLFVEGTWRHVEHLQACSVSRCAAVLVLTPLAITQGRVGAGATMCADVTGGAGVYSRQALVEEDRPAVIAMLNILHALEASCANPYSTANTPISSVDRGSGTRSSIFKPRSNPPFAVVSISHCSNALFLPLIPVPISLLSGDDSETGPCVEFRTDADEVMIDYISTGGVLMNSAMEMCSCIHSVLNPSIVPLWEAALGIHSVNQGQEQQQGQQHGANSNAVLYRRLKSQPDMTAPAVVLEEVTDKSTTMGGAAAVESCESTSPCALDKIVLPVAFKGQSFGDLFTALYDNCGVITLAICRCIGNTAAADIDTHTNTDVDGDLEESMFNNKSFRYHVLVPQVYVLPSPSTRMRAGDELFVFQPMIPPLR